MQRGHFIDREQTVWAVLSPSTAKYQTEAESSDNDFSPALAPGLLSSLLTKGTREANLDEK